MRLRRTTLFDNIDSRVLYFQYFYFIHVQKTFCCFEIFPHQFNLIV